MLRRTLILHRLKIARNALLQSMSHRTITATGHQRFLFGEMGQPKTKIELASAFQPPKNGNENSNTRLPCVCSYFLQRSHTNLLHRVIRCTLGRCNSVQATGVDDWLIWQGDNGVHLRLFVSGSDHASEAK
jgi:hypothetical protein